VIIRIKKGCSLNGSNEFLMETRNIFNVMFGWKIKKKKFILKMRIGEMREMRDGG